jgi:large subunit ribosomal protein L23
MELTVFDIIKGPVISDKAYKLNKQLGKLMLKVHQHANKALIKDALEKLFDVKVEKVNCLNRMGKIRRMGRKEFERSGVKIAIVTLAEGYSLDLFAQAEAAGGATAVHSESKSERIEE